MTEWVLIGGAILGVLGMIRLLDGPTIEQMGLFMLCVFLTMMCLTLYVLLYVDWR